MNLVHQLQKLKGQHAFFPYLCENIQGRMSTYCRLGFHAVSRLLGRWGGFVPGGGDCRRVFVFAESEGLGDALLLTQLLLLFPSEVEIRIWSRAYHRQMFEFFLPDAVFEDNTSSYFSGMRSLVRQATEKSDLVILQTYSLRNAHIFFKKSTQIPLFFPMSEPPFSGEGVLLPRDFTDVWELYSRLADDLGLKLECGKLPHAEEQNDCDVLVHVGSNSALKNWCFRNFLELRQLFADEGLNVCFICGQKDFSYLMPFFPEASGFLELPRSFSELVRRVCASRVVVCHNTSILHLAAGLGVATVSLNSEANYKWWAPYKDCENHVALRIDEPTPPRNTIADFREKYDLLVKKRALCGNPAYDQITPAMVFAAVAKQLQRFAEAKS